MFTMVRTSFCLSQKVKVRSGKDIFVYASTAVCVGRSVTTRERKNLSLTNFELLGGA